MTFDWPLLFVIFLAVLFGLVTGSLETGLIVSSTGFMAIVAESLWWLMKEKHDE